MLHSVIFGFGFLEVEDAGVKEAAKHVIRKWSETVVRPLLYRSAELQGGKVSNMLTCK